MNALYNVFASKNPPDNTIKRIEALEAKVADLDGFKDQATQQLAKHTSDIASLQGLQDILNQHDARIKALENMEAPTVSGDLDTDAILKQVNLVKSELSQVRNDLSSFSTKTTNDLAALRIELQGYTDKETGDVKKMLTKRIDDVSENLRYELERLRAEFETFRSKDFKDLEARVAALEKKFLKLQEMMANLKIPEASGGGVSQEEFDALAQRVANLEDALNMFRDQFSKWIKEMQDGLNQKADFAQLDKSL